MVLCIFGTGEQGKYNISYKDCIFSTDVQHYLRYLYVYISRYNFQRLQAPVQPGSMDSEAGVFSITFDMSGTRMITTEADKTIKVYKEDDTAVRKLSFKC